MTNKILIAGLGTMGRNYTRNLLAMAEELDVSCLIGADTNLETCRKIKKEFPELEVVHITPDATGHDSANSIRSAPNLSTVIECNDINGYIGATQTDSHLESLEDALSPRDSDGAPRITSILQEKPFGLFDDNEEQRQRIENTVKDHQIIIHRAPRRAVRMASKSSSSGAVRETVLPVFG